MEKVQFQPNVPVQVALKYPVGKIVSGNFGEQIYYTTADNRAMYLDLGVGQKVNELGARPGEPILITKRWSGKKGDQASWEVCRVQPQLPEADPGNMLQHQLRDSVILARARKAGEQPDGTLVMPAASVQPPAAVAAARPLTASQTALANDTNSANSTKLSHALRIVVDAIHAAGEHAKSIGYQMPPFSSEDIRTMANTLMIGGR